MKRVMWPRMTGVAAGLFTAALHGQTPKEIVSPVAVEVAVERLPSDPRTLRLVAVVTPAPGLHVYGPGNPGFTAVDLKVESRSGLRIGPVQLPVAEEFVFNLGESVKGYGRQFRVTRIITFDGAAWRTLSAAAELRGSLTYQACTATICLRPATLDLKWKILR